MNRRRMMMLQLANNQLDLLESYKLSYRCIYGLESIWSGNTVRLRHFDPSFWGPSQAYQRFIGTKQSASTSIYSTLDEAVSSLPTLDETKRYRMTFTVTNVEYNSATDETTDIFKISIGNSSNYYTASVNVKDIAVGTTIEVEMKNATCFYSAVFGATVGSAKWSFDFDVKFEEV